MNDLEEQMQEEGRQADEDQFAEVVQSTYDAFKALGRPHKLAVEDTNETLNIDNTAFYIDTQSIPFTDLSTEWEIEWQTSRDLPGWKRIGNWVEL